MEVLISALFVVIAMTIITGTFIRGVTRLIQRLFPWEDVPQWIETLSERFERWT